MDKETRKAKRAERIRSEIMDAAINVIGKKGYRGATTKEIAAVAGMAEGTLYNYFKNKNDIIMTIAEAYVSKKRDVQVSDAFESIEDFLGKLYAPLPEDTREAIKKEREVMRALLPEFLSDKELGKMYYERIVTPYLEGIEGNLELLKDKGKMGDYNVKAVSRLMYGAFIGFAVLSINGDPESVDVDSDFRKEAGIAYIDAFSKGLL